MIQCQDQGYRNDPVQTNIKGCGFFFPFPVPLIKILFSMKIWALLSRQKGSDFFDVIYLLGLTKPDFQFLSEKLGINNLTELKSALANLLQTVNLKNKYRDFEHLLFNEVRKNQILYFENFIHELN